MLVVVDSDFAKSHVAAYTKKDGTFVAEHDDKRKAAAKEAKEQTPTPTIGQKLKQLISDNNQTSGIETKKNLKNAELVKWVKTLYQNSNGADKAIADDITESAVATLKKNDKYITQEMLFGSPVDPIRYLKGGAELIESGILVPKKSLQKGSRFETHQLSDAGITLIKKIRMLQQSKDSNDLIPVTQSNPLDDAVGEAQASNKTSDPWSDEEWSKLRIDEGNTNAKTHHRVLEKLRSMAAAGDVEGIKSMTHGVNTYGKKRAIIAQHLLSAMGHGIFAKAEIGGCIVLTRPMVVVLQ